MPQVPVYGAPKVKTASTPVPNVQVNVPVPNIVGPVAQAVNVFEQIRQRAFDSSMFEAKADLDNWKIDNVDKVLPERLGKSAFTLEGEKLAEFDAKVAERRAQLATDEQRLAFDQIAAERRLRVRGDVANHVAQETAKYDASVFKGSQDALLEQMAAGFKDAASNRRVADEAAADVATYMGRRGYSPDEIKAAQEDARTRGHVQALDRYFATEDMKGARTYYNAVGDQIAPSALARIDERFAAAEARQRAELAAQVDLDIRDHEAMALAGIVPQRTYTQQEILSTYGPKVGPRKWEQYNSIIEAGRSIASFQTMSNADILNAVDKAKPTAADSGDFASKSAAYGHQVTAARTVLEQRAADPAAYVARNTPGVEASLQRFLSNPGDKAARDDYLRRVLGEQRRLGIENEQILPQAVADQYVGKFQTSTPEQQSQLITGLSDTFGSYWPQVFGQMSKGLPPGALVLASVDPKARAHAARALSVPKDDLFKGAASGEKAMLDDKLSQSLADLRMSLAPSVGGEETFGTVYDSAQRMAALYMQQGMAPAQAAERAAAHVSTDVYSFNSRNGMVYRVPKQFDADAVDDGTRRAIRNLTQYDLAVPAGMDKASYAAALKDGAYWVTNDDESGVYLYDSTGSAVMQSNGQPLRIRFDELAKGAD